MCHCMLPMAYHNCQNCVFPAVVMLRLKTLNRHYLNVPPLPMAYRNCQNYVFPAVLLQPPPPLPFPPPTHTYTKDPPPNPKDREHSRESILPFVKLHILSGCWKQLLPRFLVHFHFGTRTQLTSSAQPRTNTRFRCPPQRKKKKERKK